jgi:hypothetical protein
MKSIEFFLGLLQKATPHLRAFTDLAFLIALGVLLADRFTPCPKTTTWDGPWAELRVEAQR